VPESPEVDALAGFLRAHAVGRRINAVELDEFRALKTRARPLDELVGATVTGVQRLGKHIALETDGPTLVISFGRAGWATWTEEPGSVEVAAGAAPQIARFVFDGGVTLAVTDAGAWLSLGLSVVDDPHDVSSIAKLGPDPAADDFSAAAFDAVLVGRRKQLKAVLQEQESLAGIGNAYSDEILHVARLSPVGHAAALDADQRARLYAAVRDVLTSAFAARRDVPIDRQKAEKVASMRVHGRTGEACPVCGSAVLDIPGTKAGAQYCAVCQTGGVPLDD
jgi:formamidopyrimidine-DNA glycosylase